MSRLPLLGAVTTAALLAACASPAPSFTQTALADPVKVPAGHAVALETVAVGQITYECRDKKDTAGQYEWAFVGPNATLKTRTGQPVGRYFGPPATWESHDGSKVTGAQVAVSPAQPGSIPHQLVKANPTMGFGKLAGMSYVQRVATQGGVAPALACDGSSKGRRETVQYQADYIFWKAV